MMAEMRDAILTFLLRPIIIDITPLFFQLQYQYKGSTVTGKLLKKIQNGADAKSAWVVTPSDRRRKNEEISEMALGKIISAQEAMSHRGPKLKTSNPTSSNNSSSRESSPTSLSNNSDGSLDEPQIPKRTSGRGSPKSESDDNSDNGASDISNNNHAKRKIITDDVKNDNIDSRRGNKVQKTVTFSDTTGSNGAASKKNVVHKPISSKKVTASSRTIGTRSTRGSGEVELLPELPVKKKVPKVKKVVQDDNVTVVKMLTGTLYLYRGDRPRAEFVRFK